MKETLSASEWLVVSVISVLLLSVVSISKFHSYRLTSTLPQELFESKCVEITVKGAVKKPRCCDAQVGSSLLSVIKKACPEKYADLKPFIGKEVIADAVIEVTLLKEIVVRVEGAVKEAVEVNLPLGARICDLQGKIELTKDADTRFLKRKKALKYGEKVVIPRKSL